MNTENSVYVDGPLDRIFELAREIERWPAILPHYRSVRLLECSDDGLRRVAEMQAVRPGWPTVGADFPVSWRSVQVCEPKSSRIIYKHLAGAAAGMWVEWRLEPDTWGRGVHVRIAHSLRYPIPVLNGWFARDMVGHGFVGEIAGLTLSTIKSIAESEKRASS